MEYTAKEASERSSVTFVVHVDVDADRRLMSRVKVLTTTPWLREEDDLRGHILSGSVSFVGSNVWEM